MSERDDNMEAINKYFMETAKVRTAKAEVLKKEWMVWWKEHKGWSYSDDEYDTARNMRNTFNLANAVSAQDHAKVAETLARGTTSEEAAGETRRAGSDGMFVEDEKPWIPTSWKVAAITGVALVTVGVFGKKLLSLTPAAKLIKYLP